MGKQFGPICGPNPRFNDIYIKVEDALGPKETMKRMGISPGTLNRYIGRKKDRIEFPTMEACEQLAKIAREAKKADTTGTAIYLGNISEEIKPDFETLVQFRQWLKERADVGDYREVLKHVVRAETFFPDFNIWRESKKPKTQ